MALTGVSGGEQKGRTRDVWHSCGISGPARLVSVGQDKRARVQLLSVFFIIFSHRINDGKSPHKGETTVPSGELIIYKVINLLISNSWTLMKLQAIWPLYQATFCQYFSLQNQFMAVFHDSPRPLITLCTRCIKSAICLRNPIISMECFPHFQPARRKSESSVTAAVSGVSGSFLQPLSISIDPDLLPTAVN